MSGNFEYLFFCFNTTKVDDDWQFNCLKALSIWEWIYILTVYEEIDNYS